MIWKPKEKELTPEEAVALARKELEPYWYGSEPLLAGVRQGDHVSVHPLDPGFMKKSWLMFFLDFLTFDAEASLHYIREYEKRYSPHGVSFLILGRPEFPFLLERKFTLQLIEKEKIAATIAIDREGLLASAFGVTTMPRVILLPGPTPSQIAIDRSGTRWMAGTELDIQRFLRQKDPGLPLFPPIEPDRKLAVDCGRIDFGSPQVTALSGKSCGPHELSFTGLWARESDRITTSDPGATIAFRLTGTHVSLVAQTLSKESDPARAVVELNGAPAFDVFAGSDLSFDDEGRSLVKVEHPRMYGALAKLTERNPLVTLRFPSAGRIPIALYGIRFGDAMA